MKQDVKVTYSHPLCLFVRCHHYSSSTGHLTLGHESSPQMGELQGLLLQHALPAHPLSSANPSLLETVGIGA